jgi:hypothetical protein
MLTRVRYIPLGRAGALRLTLAYLPAAWRALPYLRLSRWPM